MSQIFQAACEISAHNRWCLTGTPIQNSIDDFGSLLAFIGVPPFTTHSQFRYWISMPLISNNDLSLQVLRKVIRGTSLRRTKAQAHLSRVLKMAGKSEHVELVELSADERELYEFFQRRSYLLACTSQRPKPVLAKMAHKRRNTMANANGTSEEPPPKNANNIVVLISVLRMICNHGEALLPRVAVEAWCKRKNDELNWNQMQEAVDAFHSCCICGRKISNEVEKQEIDSVELACKEHVACETCITPTDATSPVSCPKCPEAMDSVSSIRPSPEAALVVNPSSKVSALLRRVLSVLQCKKDGIDAEPPVKRSVLSQKACIRSQILTFSSVIFSQWTSMLDLIYSALQPHLTSLNIYCVGINGRSTLNQRYKALDQFNSDDNCVIMLATIGAVGEG
jgi:SNF2 family DNA or RNA helicase